MNVFISYRRRHGGRAHAFLLREKLRALGIQVFFDLISLHDKNSDYQAEIKANILQSDYFLLLLQPQMFRDLTGDDLIREIVLAHEAKKPIIAIPLDPAFNWEKERPLPKALEELGLPFLQLMPCLCFEEINVFMSNLIGRFTNHRDLQPHYRFLLEAEQRAFSGFLVPESAITNVPLEMRWCRAKRVSLLAIGGGSILGIYQRTVADLFAKGVGFRFITVDPKGKSRKDVEGKKVYSAYEGQDNGYLKQRQTQIATMIRSMQERSPQAVHDNIGYRVTGEHITMTLQWVEGENDCDSYIFVSFLPTVATNQQQADSGSALITRENHLYDFFATQFELIWQQSKVII
ncbi:MAG: toll/interleukin-1 receptor domain-containing protein [Clostridia bacterium]|nr:toll/interleukin-1 receptor domain-containing protein [Clostridia bacterium]